MSGPWCDSRIVSRRGALEHLDRGLAALEVAPRPVVAITRARRVQLERVDVRGVGAAGGHRPGEVSRMAETEDTGSRAAHAAALERAGMMRTSQ